MKLHLSPKDFGELSISQKETLRSLWRPVTNDLAVAFICTNVETDEYDEIEFVVGQVLLKEKMTSHQVILRRLRLLDEPEDEDGDGSVQGKSEDQADSRSDEAYGEDDNNGETEDENLDDEDFEMPKFEPEEYFNIEDCLPLLSIGQMIAIIRKSRAGQNGFKLFIPPDTNRIFEQRLYSMEDSEGEAFDNEELCDLLWDVVKTVL